MKHYKPTTPSLRHIVREDPKNKPKKLKKDELKEIKSLGLIKGRKPQNSGRNNQGKITIRHRGGGHKQLYRNIDFKREHGQYSLNKVESIQYNPLASGYIALMSPVFLRNTHAPSGVSTKQGIDPAKKWYILASKGLKAGDLIKGEYYNAKTLAKEGESLKLKDMEIGSKFFNLDGRLIRSAGTSGELLKTKKIGEKWKCLIRLPSSKTIEVEGEWKATLGEVSNKDHNNLVIGKAGANRWRGKRPTVRGEAMNPVDHPHGGKSHGSGGLGNPQKTKWGKLAKYIK